MEIDRLIQILVSLATIIALVFGRPISYPDNVQNLYGFPLIWGTHQLVTIAGPIDTWSINLTNLTVDLVIWIGIVLLTPHLTRMLRA